MACPEFSIVQSQTTCEDITFIFRCDGSVICYPSPWEGETTPNINGEERFLRGGLDEVQLQTEEDSLQAHTHGISDAGHSHPYDDKFPLKGGGVSCYDYRYCDNTIKFDEKHGKTSSSAKTNIEVTAVNGACTSDETRPKNMRVIYIMKIF